MYLLSDGEARFQDLVDEAGKGAVHVQSCLRTSFKRMDILFLSDFQQLLLRNLSQLDEITLVANYDDWDITDLCKLFYPLADAYE